MKPKFHTLFHFSILRGEPCSFAFPFVYYLDNIIIFHFVKICL